MPTETKLCWKALKTGGQYTVTLSAPGPEGDICNILQDEISTASLPWVGADIDYFVKSSPHFRKATLPCGHAFYVMAIAYHFRKNCMRCPVCREGEDNMLSAQTIPKHLREAIVRRADENNAQENAEELEQEEQNNMQIIQQIIQEDLADIIMAYRPRMPTHSFSRASFVLNGTIHYEQTTPTAEVSADIDFCFPLRCIAGDSLEFAVPRSHLRNFSRYLQGVGAHTVSFSVSCNNTSICMTRPLNIPIFLENGDVNMVNSNTGRTAALIPYARNETLVLGTPTIHFAPGRDAVHSIRGELMLEISRPEASTSSVFPVDGMRWVPNITELTRVMIQEML